MATFDIETNEVTTEVNEIVEIEVQSFPKIAEPIDYTWEASVQPESYAIIPTNLMGETGNLSDAVLAAIEAAYDAQLDPGGTLYLILDSLQSAINTAQTGVNQNITEIQTVNGNVSALETTVVSRLDSAEAEILSLQGTVAGIDYSQAFIVNAINSEYGGDLTSYIGSIASTYVDANSAIAADLNVLEVALGNQQVTIETLDQARIGYFSEWDGIAAPLLGQFQLIGDVYYQYLGGTLGENNDGWVRTDKSAIDAVTSLDTSLTNYVDGLIGDLQSQIDGEITTWFDDYTPDNTNEPWLSWLTTDIANGNTSEQDKHTGDIFYDTSSGYGYRFIKTVDVFSWSLITDNAITQALAAAATAQSTADGKMTIFLSGSFDQPTAKSGDMLIKSNENNQPYIALQDAPSLEAHWILVRDTTNDAAIAETAASLADLEEARDGNIVIFYETSTTIPTGMTYGDYMVDTDSWDGISYTVYRYEDPIGASSGVLDWYVSTGDTAQVLSASYRADVLAGTAQNTADGKVKVWYQGTAPILTASDVGDIWVDTSNNNTTTVWDGVSWQDQTNSEATQASVWAANASKLITDPDGNITGWEFGDGSNTKSIFKIHADQFQIANSTTGHVPFSIDGSDVFFNGKVTFTNVTDTPTINQTFVQATAPTVGMIEGDTWIDTDDGNKIYIYDGVQWNEQGAGGNTTYLQPSAPTSGMIEGDIWIDSDANYEQYRYNGTSWVPVTLNPATYINNHTTTIDGGKITTGTVLSNAFFGNVIYNLINGVPATEATYTMKIDLANGSIHIR